jgi:ferritin-like protein
MLQLEARLFETLDTPDGVPTALQHAVALEHSTIPTYLYALYSLAPGRNTEIAELIASVVIEEMSHMALACNILNAIGGSPRIDDPELIPRYPGPLPGGVESQLVVPLARFSRKLVHDVFMEIEEPEDPLRFKVRRQAVPEKTIGRFYTAIKDRLEESMFTGDPDLQVTGVFSDLGLIAVHDVETASTAIDTIVEQGEGTKQSPLDPEHDPAHYYRFAEIYHGKQLIPNEDAPPDAPPDERYVYGGPPIPFDPAGVLPVPTNPKLSDYPAGSQARYACNAFNYTYTSVLKSLHAAFNGDPGRLPAAIGLMESLKLQALDLVQIQLPSGNHAGPSFEYQPVSA